MQAILVADYSFTPLEYWRSVSISAREFIKRCLTIDPHQRMTSHEALSHPFVDMEKRAQLETDAPGGQTQKGGDLLPVIKKNFNARRTLHAAIDTIRAINKLREGGAAGLMEGAMSVDPKRNEGNGQNNDGGGAGARKGASNGQDSGYGTANSNQNHGGGDKMEGVEETGSAKPPKGKPFDPRGNARGQTEEMIRAQQRRVEDATKGLWQQGAKAMGR